MNVTIIKVLFVHKKTESSETYNKLCSYKYYGHVKECHGALFSRQLTHPGISEHFSLA